MKDHPGALMEQIQSLSTFCSMTNSVKILQNLCALDSQGTINKIRFVRLKPRIISRSKRSCQLLQIIEKNTLKLQ